MTLWSGRFDSAPDPAAFDFGISFGFDRALFEDDVTGSLAWAEALGAAGVLSPADVTTILGGLRAILDEVKRILEPVIRELGFREISLDSSVAKVSIVGAGIHNAPGYAARMFGALADAGVNIEMISTSEVRITAIVAEDDLETAVRALHDAFELAMPDPVDATTGA